MPKFKLRGSKEGVERVLRDISQVLLALDFETNFEADLITLEFPGGAVTDLSIDNPLTFIPSKFIVVDNDGAAFIYRDSANPWTVDTLYFKTSDGAVSNTVKVIIMR